ncbi:MAG: hypothetical protein ACQEQF_00110 [Bacillota bacterium]
MKIKNPKRICDMSEKEFRKWRQAREAEGDKEYGNSHLGRYGLLDELEELNDLKHIHYKLLDRIKKEEYQLAEMAQPYYEDYKKRMKLYNDIYKLAERLTEKIIELDGYLYTQECTDENGGKRIGWPKEK